MDVNLTYVIGAVVAVILVPAFVYGAWDKLANLRSVWSMLRERFGVPASQFSRLSDDDGVLGTMSVFDDEFVGTTFVVPQGILFDNCS